MPRNKAKTIHFDQISIHLFRKPESRQIFLCINASSCKLKVFLDGPKGPSLGSFGPWSKEFNKKPQSPLSYIRNRFPATDGSNFAERTPSPLGSTKVELAQPYFETWIMFSRCSIGFFVFSFGVLGFWRVFSECFSVKCCLIFLWVCDFPWFSFGFLSFCLSSPWIFLGSAQSACEHLLSWILLKSGKFSL